MRHMFAFRGATVSIDDSGAASLATATGFANEQLPSLYRAQQHGFASNPPAGSQGLIIPMLGDRARSAVLGLESPTLRQSNLPSGTAVLYDDKGNVIRAYGSSGIQISAKNGDISVQPATGKKVFTGGDGVTGSYAPVMTEQGPSLFHYARYA